MHYEHFKHYALGADSLGTGFGVIALLIRWAGVTLFLSLAIFLQYGVIAVAGYAVATVFAMPILGLLGKRIRSEIPEGYTIGDYLRAKLNTAGYRMMLLMMVLTCIESILLPGQIIKDYLTAVAGGASPVLLGGFYGVCFLYAGMGGIKAIHGLAITQVVLIYAAVILTPMYFFFTYGVQPIYDGIRLYHPYLLVTNYYHGIGFMAAGVVIGVGQIITDSGLWQRVYMIAEKKVLPAFLLAGFLLAALPVAFSSMFMAALFTGGYSSTASLWLNLLEQIDMVIFKALFVSCMFCVALSVCGSGIHAFGCLITRAVYPPTHPGSSEQQKLQVAYLCALVACCCSVASIYFFSQPVLKALIAGGHSFVATAMGIVFIIGSNKSGGVGVPLCAVTGAAAGWAGQEAVGEAAGIFITVAVSLALMGIHCFFIKNKG